MSIALQRLAKPTLLRPLATNNLQYQLRAPQISQRTMATTHRKWEYLVLVPDKPGMQAKRLEVRAKHLEVARTHFEAGTFKAGGATLEDVPEGDDPTTWTFKGSNFIMVATSKDQVVEVLKKDIYSTSGVWDVDNAQIMPIKIAMIKP